MIRTVMAYMPASVRSSINCGALEDYEQNFRPGTVIGAKRPASYAIQLRRFSRQHLVPQVAKSVLLSYPYNTLQLGVMVPVVLY